MQQRKPIFADYQRLIQALEDKYGSEEVDLFLSDTADAMINNALAMEKRWIKHLLAPDIIRTCRIPSKFPQPTHCFNMHYSFNIVSPYRGEFLLIYDPTCILQPMIWLNTIALGNVMDLRIAELKKTVNQDSNYLRILKQLISNGENIVIDAQTYPWGKIISEDIPLEDFSMIRCTGGSAKLSYFGRADQAKGLLYYGQVPYTKTSKLIMADNGIYDKVNKWNRPSGALFDVCAQISYDNTLATGIVQIDQFGFNALSTLEAETNGKDLAAGTPDADIPTVFQIMPAALPATATIENFQNSIIKKATSGMKIVWTPIDESGIQHINTTGTSGDDHRSVLHFVRGEGLPSNEGAIIHVDIWRGFEAVVQPRKRELYNPKAPVAGDYGRLAGQLQQIQNAT